MSNHVYITECFPLCCHRHLIVDMSPVAKNVLANALCTQSLCVLGFPYSETIRNYIYYMLEWVIYLSTTYVITVHSIILRKTDVSNSQCSCKHDHMIGGLNMCYDFLNESYQLHLKLHLMSWMLLITSNFPSFSFHDISLLGK